KKQRTPTPTRSLGNLPALFTNAGICSGGSMGLASASTTCRPTPSVGSMRAMATASSAAGAAIIKLAAVGTPLRWASAPAPFPSGVRRKSWAVKITFFIGARFPYGAATMTVLVTGATGFIGSAVARQLLERGEPVRVIARKGGDRRNLANLPVEIIEGDL